MCCHFQGGQSLPWMPLIDHNYAHIAIQHLQYILDRAMNTGKESERVRDSILAEGYKEGDGRRITDKIIQLM